jgi:hypothetical protein
MKRLNLNEPVYVKLTEDGLNMYLHKKTKDFSMMEELKIKGIKKPTLESLKSKANEFGYHQFQFWDFMNIFGEYFMIGRVNIIKDNCIYFDEEDIMNNDDLKWERSLKIDGLI